MCLGGSTSLCGVTSWVVNRIVVARRCIVLLCCIILQYTFMASRDGSLSAAAHGRSTGLLCVRLATHVDIDIPSQSFFSIFPAFNYSAIKTGKISDKKANVILGMGQNSSHKTPVIKLSRGFHLHLTSRRVLVTKIFIALPLDESLHPRKLRFLLAALPVEVCVRIAIDAVFRRSVCFALIGVIKPLHSQYSSCASPNHFGQLTCSHDPCTQQRPPASCVQSPTCRFRFPETVARS